MLYRPFIHSRVLQRQINIAITEKASDLKLDSSLATVTVETNIIIIYGEI